MSSIYASPFLSSIEAHFSEIHPSLDDVFYVILTLLLYTIFTEVQKQHSKKEKRCFNNVTCSTKKKLSSFAACGTISSSGDADAKPVESSPPPPPRISKEAPHHFHRHGSNASSMVLKPQQVQQARRPPEKDASKYSDVRRHSPTTKKGSGSNNNNDCSSSSADLCTLLIAYMPWEATEEEVSRKFEEFVKVKRVRFVVDRVSRKPRCFGFVKFCSHQDAAEALRYAQMGRIALPDLRGHMWHLKAEWASTEMVIDDCQKERIAHQRKNYSFKMGV